MLEQTPGMHKSDDQDRPRAQHDQTKGNRHEATETTPVIDDNHDTLGETSPLLPRDDHPYTKRRIPRWRTVRSPNTIVVVVLCCLFLACSGDGFIESPETRIFESIICYRYYEKADPSKIRLSRDVVGPGAIGGVDEMWCKADQIQDELALINGYQLFFDGIPALLLGLPFGWAADRYGRWPILFLNMLQFALRAMWKQFVTWNWQAIDVRVIWASSALSLFGGGNATAAAMVFVTVSDVLPSKERAGAFLRLAAINYAPGLFVPLLAAWLMTVNPWIPYLLGTLMMLLATALCLILPETLDYNTQDHGRPAEVLQADVEEIAHDQLSTEDPRTGSIMHRSWQKFKSVMSFLTNDWRVPVLILPFLTHNLIGEIGRLVLQYISKRYELTFAKSTILASVFYNGARVLMLFALLPWITTFVTKKYRLSDQSKDLYLARASQALVAIGWLCVAASPQVWTMCISLVCISLGAGSTSLIRSFLTSLLPTHHVARTYTLIGIVDTLGCMFGTPLLAGLFQHGLVLGEGWIGLPFYFVGTVSALLVGVLCLVHLRKGESCRA